MASVTEPTYTRGPWRVLRVDNHPFGTKSAIPLYSVELLIADEWHPIIYETSRAEAISTVDAVCDGGAREGAA